jgi:hypothetical protein
LSADERYERAKMTTTLRETQVRMVMIAAAAFVACKSGVVPDQVPPEPANATDGVKDSDETDVDCGGTQTPKCAGGKTCVADGNCLSNVCSGSVCTEPLPDVEDAGTGAAGPDCELSNTCSETPDAG